MQLLNVVFCVRVRACGIFCAEFTLHLLHPVMRDTDPEYAHVMPPPTAAQPPPSSSSASACAAARPHDSHVRIVEQQQQQQHQQEQQPTVVTVTTEHHDDDDDDDAKNPKYPPMTLPERSTKYTRITCRLARGSLHITWATTLSFSFPTTTTAVTFSKRHETKRWHRRWRRWRRDTH